MEGSFALPLKLMPKWDWEHTWGTGSIMALLLVPWPVAILTVPNLWDVYRQAPTEAVLMALLFGAGWGAGGVFFGLGVNAIGLSVGLSLIMGLIAVNGSLIPFLMEHPDQLTERSGLILMAGIAVMLLGLAVCAIAGSKKQSAGSLGETHAAAQKIGAAFIKGVSFCIAAGIFSALVNFGLIYGTRVADQAVARGAERASAVNAVWALVFTSNYMVNAGYCAYLMWRNRSGTRYLRNVPGWYWFAAALMGAVWAGGIVVYGMGAARLGQLGAFIGFPMMLIASILTGNILGFLSGEWRFATRPARRIMAGGVSLLCLAALILGFSNWR